MATSIDGGFKILRDNLRITSLQTSTVSTRQTNVRAAIESEMSVLDSFLTGSYKRGTMIAPLAKADIDIFMVLNSEYFKHGPAGLLDKVRRVLLKTYNTPDISRDGQAVTIKFNDFKVDVVPGFYRKDGGYLIPNSYTDNWISTNPKRHVEIFADANKWHNYNLAPLVKMVKRWNRIHGQYFNSFHLEIMTMRILDNVTITDFPSGVRFVFDKARERVLRTLNDPAGYGDDLSQYMSYSTAKDEVLPRLQRAYDNAVDAEYYANNGQIKNAFERWQQIFGDYFPSYN